MEGLILLLVIGAVIFAGLGGWVASQKRRETIEGLALGALFGPFGVLIEALLPTGTAGPASGQTTSTQGRSKQSQRELLSEELLGPNGQDRSLIICKMRDALEAADPNWRSMTPARRLQTLKPVETELAKVYGAKMRKTEVRDMIRAARQYLDT